MVHPNQLRAANREEMIAYDFADDIDQVFKAPKPSIRQQGFIDGRSDPDADKAVTDEVRD